MAKREIKRWITINGVHVPIYEGSSVKEAVNNFIDKVSNTKTIEYPKKGFKNKDVHLDKDEKIKQDQIKKNEEQKKQLDASKKVDKAGVKNQSTLEKSLRTLNPDDDDPRTLNSAMNQLWDMKSGEKIELKSGHDIVTYKKNDDDTFTMTSSHIGGSLESSGGHTSKVDVTKVIDTVGAWNKRDGSYSLSIKKNEDVSYKGSGKEVDNAKGDYKISNDYANNIMRKLGTALPLPGDFTVYGNKDLADVVDAVNKQYGLNNERQALDWVLDNKVSIQDVKKAIATRDYLESPQYKLDYKSGKAKEVLKNISEGKEYNNISSKGSGAEVDKAKENNDKFKSDLKNLTDDNLKAMHNSTRDEYLSIKSDAQMENWEKKMSAIMDEERRRTSKTNPAITGSGKAVDVAKEKKEIKEPKNFTYGKHAVDKANVDNEAEKLAKRLPQDKFAKETRRKYIQAVYETYVRELMPLGHTNAEGKQMVWGNDDKNEFYLQTNHINAALDGNLSGWYANQIKIDDYAPVEWRREVTKMIDTKFRKAYKTSYVYVPESFAKSHPNLTGSQLQKKYEAFLKKNKK